MGRSHCEIIPTFFCFLFLITNASPTFSQAENDKPAKTRTTVLEEVVVSARKRDETLTATAFSVYVVSGDALDKFGVDNFNDVAEFTPNMVINDTPVGAPAILIRGVGSLSTLNPFELSVGLSVDGVYFGNAHWFQSGLFDTSQLEVLRGPQGVDFGKNTTAGLINIRSKDPSEELEASLRIAHERETEENLLELGVGGPVSETVKVRLAGQFRDNTGYQESVEGDDLPNLSRKLARATVLWLPKDTLGVKYKAFYSDFDTVGLGNELIQCDPVYGAFLSVIGSTDNCVADDVVYGSALTGGVVQNNLLKQSGQKGEMYSHALAFDWDIGDINLVATTGFQHMNVVTVLDNDYTDARFLDTGFDDLSEQFSQEIRLNIPLGESFHTVVGAYYEKSERTYRTLIDLLIAGTPLVDVGLLGIQLPSVTVGTSVDGALETTGEAAAVFGDITYDVTQSLSINLGLRYTREKKEAELNQQTGDHANPDSNLLAGELVSSLFHRTDVNGLTGERMSEHLDPSATLQWQYGDLLNLSSLDSGQFYISYKEGYKSGSFDSIAGVDNNGTPNSPFEFQDETVKGYEIGTKIEALQRKLRGSVALFLSEYENLQLQYLPSGDTLLKTINAGSSVTQGVETDMRYLLSSELQLSAAMAYTVAEYDQFKNAPCYSNQTEANGCVNDEQDLSGVTLAQAPKYSGNVGINYDTTIGSTINFALGIQASYTDDILFNVFGDPSSAREGYWLTNARMTIAAIDRKWELGLLVRNLTDKRTLSLKSEAPLSAMISTKPSYFGNLNEPRTISVQLSLKL